MGLEADTRAIGPSECGGFRRRTNESEFGGERVPPQKIKIPPSGGKIISSNDKTFHLANKNLLVRLPHMNEMESNEIRVLASTVFLLEI